MAKKLVSFRMEEHRIEELRELANVYTNGNATDLIEHLIRRMYFLEPLALLGKCRTPGFGIAGEDRKRIKSAWDIWINESFLPAKPKIKTPIVYTNGRKTQLSERKSKKYAKQPELHTIQIWHLTYTHTGDKKVRGINPRAFL